jgi:hypothetical protein
MADGYRNVYKLGGSLTEASEVVENVVQVLMGINSPVPVPGTKDFHATAARESFVFVVIAVA